MCLYTINSAVVGKVDVNPTVRVVIYGMLRVIQQISPIRIVKAGEQFDDRCLASAPFRPTSAMASHPDPVETDAA